MKNYKSFLLAFAGLVTLLFSGLVHAEDAGQISTKTEKPEEPATPSKFKANIASYYYNMEGTKAASGDLYSFGLTEVKLQLMTLQYQASPSWTFMAIGQYLENHVVTNMAGQVYNDTTKGLGDTYLSAVHPLLAKGPMMVLSDAGVSLPTGSYNMYNRENEAARYPFNMQLGSGTVDPMLGLTVLYLAPAYQLGSRLGAILRTGEINGAGYHLGNQYKLDAWANYNLGWGITPRLVGYYKDKEPISGVDPTLGRNPYDEFYYHPQINYDISAALRYEGNIIQTLSIGTEVGVPIFQDMINNDHVVVSSNYWGDVFVNGTF